MPRTLTTPDGTSVDTWDVYIGQRNIKEQLEVHILAAESRHEALPHILLATPEPGFGKTLLASVIATRMAVQMTIVVPPVLPQRLLYEIGTLQPRDIIFIDEIHRMSTSHAETLLTVLEEGIGYQDGQAKQLPDITVIGATTRPGKLPDALRSRFQITPHFTRYTRNDLCAMAARFIGRFDDDPDYLTMLGTIADASQGNPRKIRHMANSLLALEETEGHVSPSRLLEFTRIDADGLDHYQRMYMQLLEKTSRPLGLAAIASLMRDSTDEIRFLERPLVHMGYVELSNAGRQLTAQGIRRVTLIA